MRMSLLTIILILVSFCFFTEKSHNTLYAFEKESSSMILGAYFKYIHIYKKPNNMKTFLEYLNESRTYDNQGHAIATIKKMQSELVRLGFLAPKLYNGNDAIDGKFGQATTEALSKYQLANSLNDSKGVINKETLQKLGIDTLIFGSETALNSPKVNSEDLSGLGNFTPSAHEGAPLIIVYGGIDVKGRQSGDYMYDYFNKTGNLYNLFVSKNHRVDGLGTYNSVINYVSSHNIYPQKKVLYLFSGGVRAGYQLLKSVSPNEFEKIYLVDIYIGKNQGIADFYTGLAKSYPNKVEYYYTGSDSNAGGSVNLGAKLKIKNAVAVSKQGSNHMLTNVDAVSSLMSYFKF